MDVAIREHEYSGNEDRTWTATRKGYDTCRSLTLDVSTFDAAHIAAKGAIPSGTVIAKITASGKYGPYDPEADDGREIAEDGRLFLLFNTTRVGGGGSDVNLNTAADVGAPGFWEGVVIADNLPSFEGTDAGELDGKAVYALQNHIRFEGTFPAPEAPEAPEAPGGSD